MSECNGKQGNGIIFEGVSSAETLWKGMELQRTLENFREHRKMIGMKFYIT